MTKQNEPVAWMTRESAARLKSGGNSKGAVPVHQHRSSIASIPLYARPSPEPMSQEEILDFATKNGIKKSSEHWGDRYYTELGRNLFDFARAIEARSKA